jgi:hypothetical protein
MRYFFNTSKIEAPVQDEIRPSIPVAPRLLESINPITSLSDKMGPLDIPYIKTQLRITW